jgi:hypothetical protein
MIEETNKYKNKSKEYGDALNMSDYEKKISFLNRYFVYKKIRNVNTEKVNMEFSDYNYSEIERDTKETKDAVSISKEVEKETKKKNKIRKLSRKLILDPSTEATE